MAAEIPRSDPINCTSPAKGAEDPSAKIQAPEKAQTPGSKTRQRRVSPLARSEAFAGCRRTGIVVNHKGPHSRWDRLRASVSPRFKSVFRSTGPATKPFAAP